MQNRMLRWLNLIPKYLKDIEMEVNREHIQSMLNKCNTIEHKVVIVLLYLTGARTSEVTNLTTDDFVEGVDDEILISLPTKKGGYPRTLPIGIGSPFMSEIIIPYLAWLKNINRKRLFVSCKSRHTVHGLFNKTSDKLITPYTFRHNRLTKLAKIGASPYELMIWKGAKNLKSVAPYIAKSPAMVKRLRNKIF